MCVLVKGTNRPVIDDHVCGACLEPGVAWNDVLVLAQDDDMPVRVRAALINPRDDGYVPGAGEIRISGEAHDIADGRELPARAVLDDAH